MTETSSKRIYRNDLSMRNKVERFAWGVASLLLISWTPRPFFGKWRCLVLRAFGARIGEGCKIFPRVRVWLPRNLQMGHFSCLGEGVDCYNVAPIKIGNYVTVSQRSYLCSASHDHQRRDLPLVTAPITIEDNAWICAETYVGPGVTVGEGTVLAARAAATKSLEAWSIYGGIPANRITERRLNNE